VQALIRSITYQTSGAAAGQRKINFSVTQGHSVVELGWMSCVEG
jgi:hypothetical protein